MHVLDSRVLLIAWDILVVTIGQFTIQFSLSADIFSAQKNQVIETNCNTSVTDWQLQKIKDGKNIFESRKVYYRKNFFEAKYISKTILIPSSIA